MPNVQYLTPRKIAADPGMILLTVLLFIFAVIFIWWPTDIYLADVSLVAWLMLATLPVSIFLTGYYVVWMERRERSLHSEPPGSVT